MANLRKSLAKLMRVDGAIGVALVDAGEGLTLATAGGGPGLDLEMAGAGQVDVVRAEQRVMDRLARTEKIEDMMIVLGPQFHFIQPLTRNRQLFLYLVLDRERGNLGMARFVLRKVAERLAL